MFHLKFPATIAGRRAFIPQSNSRWAAWPRGGPPRRSGSTSGRSPTSGRQVNAGYPSGSARLRRPPTGATVISARRPATSAADNGVGSPFVDGFLPTVAVGVATGLAASALFWWLQAKLLRSKIVICPDLRLNLAGDSKSRMTCEFILINRSRFAAADISIKANFSIPGLMSERGVFHFYMRDLTAPWMDPGERNEYYVGSKYIMQEDEQKEYGFRLEKRLGKSLDQLDMRELMEACAGSYVTVFVSSNHAFSGARSFKRAIFTEKNFILATDACERANCCRNPQVRWSNMRHVMRKLARPMSVKY